MGSCRTVARQVAAAVALAAWAALFGTPTVLAASPSPAPTSDTASVCQAANSQDALSAAMRVACDQVRGAAQQFGQAVGQAGQTVTDAAETAFTRWLANGAAWVIQGVSKVLASSSTTPTLDSTRASMFSGVYARVVGVALSLSVLLVLIGVIEATLTQRPGALRRVVVGIAVSGISLGAIPVATAILLRIVDDLSQYVAGDQTQMVSQGMSTFIQVLQGTSPGDGAAAFALTALGTMLGGTLLWLELVTRQSLIYLFLAVAPLACAAVQWPRLEGVLRQVLFTGLALILSKLVIVITLAVGFAVLASWKGLESLLGGMFILIIAGLMPFATARVLPLAGEELLQNHQGRVRGWIVAGASAVTTTARVAASIAGGGVGAASIGVPLAPPMGSAGSRGQGNHGRPAHVAAAASAGPAAAEPVSRSATAARRGTRPRDAG